MYAKSYLLAALAAAPALAAPNNLEKRDSAPAPTSTGLSGAQSSAVFAAWYLYAMTVPMNPTIASLVEYVQTAVPTNDYTYTSSALPTSFDVAGYLNAPPQPSFPAWLSDIPDAASMSAFSSLIVSLEDASISLGKLATAGTINGTLFPGIVPAATTAPAVSGPTAVVASATGSVITQISDGQIQAPATQAPASFSTSANTTVSTAAAPSATATVAPYKGAAASVGVSVAGVMVAGVVGLAALL